MKQAMTKGIFTALFRNINLPFLASILLLGACSKDDNSGQTLPDGEYPMTFTAAGIALSVETKATTDNNWQDVQQVAVQVDGAVKPYGVQASADDNYTTATLSSDDPFYWQNTEPVTVSAWWPYAETMPDVVVQADQNSEANFNKSDYISATNTITFGGSTALTFTHRTAKVTVALERGEGMTDEELEGATVTLAGVSTGQAANAIVTPYQNTTALLPPQTVQAGEPFIQVTLKSGATYSYCPDEAIMLKEGFQYNYTITVHKTGLGVENATIDGWGDGGTTPGTALPEVNTVTIVPWDNGGNASFETRAATNGDTWTWADGDQVALNIGGVPYTLTYGNGSWSPAEFTGIALPATINAWWPNASNASANDFNFIYSGDTYSLYNNQVWIEGTIDQQSEELLAACDWMTCNASLTSPTLDINMAHRLCKVTVTIKSYEGWPDGYIPTITNPRFFTIAGPNNEIDNREVIPLTKSDGEITYTAIIVPYYYIGLNMGAYPPFMKLTVDGTDLLVTLPFDFALDFKTNGAGKAYAFNLTIKNPTSTRSAAQPACELVQVQNMNE